MFNRAGFGVFPIHALHLNFDEGPDMTKKFISSDPYLWPYDGDFSPHNTALLIIDMQTDFCGRGGYGHHGL